MSLISQFSRPRHLCLVVVLACIMFPSLVLAESEGRVALVIGNSAYTASPLSNPVHDAQDVGAALSRVGFDVLVRTDLDLAGMERAVEDFIIRLAGAQTALIYYAGHGVQVQGENYLIPVRETISTDVSVRSRSLGLSDLLARVSRAGATTLLVFLDSCRDNPFPGSSRSGSRGLSVVATPSVVESLIAYATEPGDIARDGTGRNGIFTASFLKNLEVEDRSLTDMMTSVRSEVMAKTANSQRPRVDSALSRPFYFLSSSQAAARAKKELERVQRELAALESAAAEREAKLAAVMSAEERTKLEIERQKQSALEVAKRLEVANAQRESERLAAEALKRRSEEEERRKQAEAETARLVSLRQEAGRLKADADSRRPVMTTANAYISRIDSLANALDEIDKRYREAEQSIKKDIVRLYDTKVLAVEEQKRQAWESEQEYRTRLDREKTTLASIRESELATRRSTLQAEQAASEKDLRLQLSTTISSLTGMTFTVSGSNVLVRFGSFDTGTKSWPVSVESRDPAFRYSVNVRHDISASRDIGAEYTKVQKVIDSGGLAAEIDYRFVRVSGDIRDYKLKVEALRVRDLVSGSILVSQSVLPAPEGYRIIDGELAFFGKLEYVAPENLVVRFLRLPSRTWVATVNGQKNAVDIPEGEYELQTRLHDDPDWAWSTKVRVSARGTQAVVLPSESSRRSIAWRIGEEKSRQKMLLSRKEKDSSLARQWKSRGTAGMVVGGLGGIASGALYAYLSGLYADYQSVVSSAEKLRIGRTVSSLSTVFSVSAAIAGGGLVFGGVSFAMVPPIGQIEKELAESIERLRKLDAENTVK